MKGLWQLPASWRETGTGLGALMSIPKAQSKALETEYAKTRSSRYKATEGRTQRENG